MKETFKIYDILNQIYFHKYYIIKSNYTLDDKNVSSNA